MRIYLGVASTTYRENSKYYNKILQAVAELGHDGMQIDAQTKVGTAGDQSSLDEDDWNVLCQREITRVLQSDAVILDVTNKATFGIGYVAAVALQHNKPTLFLQREDGLNGSFITGLRHPNLKRATFASEGDLTGIVGRFLEGAV